MRKNIKKVIEAFKLGLPAQGDSNRTCWTDGKAIFSYKMRIAWRESDGSVTVTTEKSSRTTNSQIQACRVALVKESPCKAHDDCRNNPALGKACKEGAVWN